MRYVLLVLALAACSKSKCEKYADWEWKCGNYPADQKEITLKLAQGMCVAGENGEKGAERFAKEAECALKAKDCAEYKACGDKIEP
ncbi:MAG TPA: hypothetical protein VFV99_26560 [Kofleriaceae bacterium]|nr:hypothetical protein [Kofleriaceae bacterium]